MQSTVSTLAKMLSWFAVVTGILTLLTPVVLRVVSGRSVPDFTILIWTVLGFASVLGGYFGLKARAWAFWLLFFLFLVQTAEFLSPAFFFSFIGPLSIKLGWGWNTPPRQFNINLLAIIAGVVAVTCAMRISQSARTSDVP